MHIFAKVLSVEVSPHVWIEGMLLIEGMLCNHVYTQVANVLSCIAPAAVGLNSVRAIEICNDP